MAVVLNPFIYQTVTTGYAWSNTDKGSASTLTNGNLTVSTSSSVAANNGVRGQNGQSAGKWYYEGTIDVDGTSFLTQYLGFAKTSASLDISFDLLDKITWRRTSGAVYACSSLPVLTWSFVVGDVLCFALDLDNNKVWVRKNGGLWNNSGSDDPTTNTGGFSITAGTWAPHWWGRDDVLMRATANFGPTYTYTKPTGFNDWS